MSQSGIAIIIPSLLKKRTHFSVVMPDMSSRSIIVVVSFCFPYYIEVVKFPYLPESNWFISHGVLIMVLSNMKVPITTHDHYFLHIHT